MEEREKERGTGEMGLSSVQYVFRCHGLHSHLVQQCRHFACLGNPVIIARSKSVQYDQLTLMNEALM